MALEGATFGAAFAAISFAFGAALVATLGGATALAPRAFLGAGATVTSLSTIAERLFDFRGGMLVLEERKNCGVLLL